MAETRPTGNQITFHSAQTGVHVLDEYLELAESGGRTLGELMEDLFLPDGALRPFEFQVVGNALQYRPPGGDWATVANYQTFHDSLSTLLAAAQTASTSATSSAASATASASGAAVSATAAAASAASAASSATAAAASAASIAGGPVTSVNAKTGVVVLAPSDIGAAPAALFPAPVLADAGKILRVKADGSGFETVDAGGDGALTASFF